MTPLFIEPFVHHTCDYITIATGVRQIKREWVVKNTYSNSEIFYHLHLKGVSCKIEAENTLQDGDVLVEKSVRKKVKKVCLLIVLSIMTYFCAFLKHHSFRM